MNKFDPTGRAYRDALVHVRGAAPDAATAITVHIAHLERLVARLRTEQHGVDARIRELLEIKTSNNGDPTNPDLLVVTHEQQPIGMTSPEDITATAMRLVEDLMKSDQTDAAIVIAAAGVRHGPMEGPILALTLQFIVEQTRPLIASIRAAASQQAPWPWQDTNEETGS